MTAARRFSGPALEELGKVKILDVRAGTEHRYTGVWVVVVEGRVFVRSWNDNPAASSANTLATGVSVAVGDGALPNDLDLEE